MLGVAAVLGAWGVAFVWATHRTPTADVRAACERTLDRYVELRLRSADPKVTDVAIASAQVAAQKAAARRGDDARCERSLSAENEACATRAHSDAELEQCFP